ncbi:tigger transposable element-derived protein 6-like [Uloborus diversus]|uniref:tigger transposable element-derived protein 6-like n=1 Tax=Uloborus diversus TaxID=327109 RepID=UPI0024095404|nr:tigger transposable element-derived protein 6-like [Uloborus diversus]
MPRKYVRNHTVAKGQWTEENLILAMAKVKNGEISENKASRLYGIPIRTLSRRLKTGDTKKTRLGPQASLGKENEKRLASYVKRLANAGFPLDRSTIRSLAYQFAEKLGIQHKFPKEKEKADQHWLTSFLERNKDVSVRQAEGLSVARAQGMNREEVGAFFKLLEEEMVKHDLTNRPENIFNVDETGIQLINKPGKILTAKGAKDVHVITPREKGETISLVACCSAEGRFLPPVLIMKGVNKKAEFSDVYGDCGLSYRSIADRVGRDPDG